MSEDDYGANANGPSFMKEDGEPQQNRNSMVNASRTIGARSASPAKRSAADMEDTGSKETRVPGSFAQQDDSEPTDFDNFMEDLSETANAGSQGTQTQNNLVSYSVDRGMEVDGAASEDGPTTNGAQSEASHQEPYTTEEIDRQYQHVFELMSKPLDEGDRAVIISSKWLSRVLSRSSDNLKNSEYPKEAREGPVGPLDNSDIVAEGVCHPPFLKDLENADFIPLKPGLAIDEQYMALPYETFGYIVGLYGCREHAYGSKPIIRYAHDTAPPGASQTNIQYEIYPPVVTVRKMPQPASESEQSAKPKQSASLDGPRLKREREGRGQQSPDDAAQLVSSSTESYNKFLIRAKAAAGIPTVRKVKVWRMTSTDKLVMHPSASQQSGVPSPPASRDTSPAKPSSTRLVVDKESFEKLEVGKDMEIVDLPDNSSDPNYKGIGKLSMDDAGLKTGVTTIILEEQIGGPAGGEYRSDSKKMINRVIPRKVGSKNGSGQNSGRTSPAPGMMTRGRTRKDDRTRGTVGLMNLGNTCYMNSALQCIRSVEELAVYFLSQKYKKEINNDNPLGHHGAMANAYSSVLKGIYESSTGGAFSPTNFKKTLGSIQPMFSGYGQQDSQEFLSFLVDALHEDLNRIIKKPYIENPDSDDNRVSDPEYIRELGETYRSNHRKRNDSVAMDLFSGFYKNTMECPTCDKVSVTFDPYSLLTVQLPIDHAFQHTITFIPLVGRPVLHEIDMDKNSTLKTLKEHIAKKHVGVEANRLWIVEVYNHKIYKVFDDASTLAEANIGSSDHIFMYELDAVPKNTPSTKKSYSLYTTTFKKDDEVPAEGMESEKADVFTVPVFHRLKKSTSNVNDMMLFPVYITLTREEAQDSEVILKKVLIAVSNITTRNILTEFDEDRGPSGTVQELDGADDASKEQANGDDSAGVSDHSAQSEDGYVKVSLDKHEDVDEEVDGSSPMKLDDVDRKVPSRFMHPEYFVPPALRDHLFDIKYAESHDNNMHCASMNGFRDMTVKPLFDRVKKASRRTSVQSSASDESSQSTDSGNQANGESDESDEDKPDIVLGDAPGAALSAETVEESEEDELAISHPTTIMEPSPIDHTRHGRDRNKRRRGKKGGRGKRGALSNGFGGGPPRLQGRPLFSPSKSSDEGPYYVQLGECIVLDWKVEGFDALFNGNDNDPEEIRGSRITDDTGRNGPLYDDEELKARKDKRAERKKNGIGLEDCFAETGKREALSEDNAWYCNRCKELRQAHKTLEIWTIPDILVVHMKRFGGTRSFRDKLDVFVDYPIEGLDMTDKVGVKEDGKEYIYDLFAVDNHFGGLGGGHYTAYAKNFYDGEWYDYNDSITSKIAGGRNIKSAAAYLLFYRRRSDKPLGSEALQELVLEHRKPISESADEVDDESGEVKLGGPTLSSQHRNGSSSVSAGQGVAVTSSQRGLGAENGGVGVDSLRTQRPMMRSDFDDDEDALEEQTHAGTLMSLTQASSGWNFDRIDNADDNDSTKAEYDDRDSGIASSLNGMDTSGLNTPSRAQNSPAMQSLLGLDDHEDEHFSDAAIHMEGGYAPSIEDDTPHDIVLDDAPEDAWQEKRD